MGQPIFRVVAGIIREGSRILLVGQRGPTDPHDIWSIPGGVVEDGELLDEALIREVREETGLEVAHVGGLAYATQLDNPDDAAQAFAFIFEIQDWSGSIHVDDPDGKVFSAEFFDVNEAIAKLKQVPWEHMRDPIAAYLKGEVPKGTFWLYRQEGLAKRRLIRRL